MLMVLPRILADNPECYRVERGKGYVPTDIASPEEKAAIKKYNKAWHEGRRRMVVIDIDERHKKLLIKQAKEHGISDEEINSWFE